MAAVAVITTGAYGATKVSAASDSSTSHSSLVQKLADTLHVDKSKVQAVFDQNKSDQQANHEKAYEARLAQAVTDGKLTAAQKTLLLAEHNQLKSELTTAMTGPDANRRAAMDKVRSEGQAWAKANSLDAKWLLGGGFGGRGHHGGMMNGDMMGHGQDGDADDAATPTASPSPAPGV